MLILKLFIFISIIFSLGFVFLKRILLINSLVYLVPFSFVIGMAFFLDIISIFAYFFGISNAVILALILMLIFSLLIVYFKKTTLSKVDINFTKNELSILGLFLLILSIVTIFITDTWPISDYDFHLSSVNHFLKTNKFPNDFSNWPHLFTPYHYGFDIICAGLASFFRIDATTIFKFIVSISSVTTFLSAFALSKFIIERFPNLKNNSNDFFTTFSGAIFFYFTGNFLLTDSIFRYLFKLYPVQEGWSFLKTVLNLGFHGGVFNDIASGGILFPSFIFGIQFFLVFLVFLYKFINSDKFNYFKFILLFVLGIALIHTAESILFTLLCSLFLMPIVTVLISRKENPKKVVLRCLMSAGLILLIIFLNSISYNFLKSNYYYLPTFLELTLNPNFPMIEIFGRFGDVNNHMNISVFSWDYISELGIQFLLSIIILWWVVKNNSKFSSLAISIFLIGTISSMLLYIKSSPPDSLRLLHPGIELLNMLFCLFALSNLKNIFKPIFFFFFTFQPLLKFLLAGIFTLSIFVNSQYPEVLNSVIRESVAKNNVVLFTEQLKNLKNMVRNSYACSDVHKNLSNYLLKNYTGIECGISINPKPFDLAGIPCYISRTASLPKRLSFFTLLKTLDPFILKELNIKWIYIDSQSQQYIDEKIINEMIKFGYLKLIKTEHDELSDQYSSLYEFVNLDDYISKYERRVYWTYVKYMNDTLIVIPEGNEIQSVYLFKTEKEANNFLKEIIKKNKNLDLYKPFVNAVEKDLILGKAQQNGFLVKYL